MIRRALEENLTLHWGEQSAGENGDLWSQMEQSKHEEGPLLL